MIDQSFVLVFPLINISNNNMICDNVIINKEDEFMFVKKGKDIIYEVEDDKVYKFIPGFFGKKKVVAYTLEDNLIIEGKSSFGKVVAHIEGNQIIEGLSEWGAVLYTIDGNRIVEGPSEWGMLVYTIEG